MKIDLSRIRAVCFDVDGTLSDTDDQFVMQLLRIFSPLRYFIGEQLVKTMARKLVMMTEGPGNWFYTLADKLGMDDKIVAMGGYLYQMGIGETTQPFLLIDGVREMLARLSQQYPLSIISTRGQKSTFRFLCQFDLLPYFKAVATGQTCAHTKPYPDPIRWAADQMGVEPGSCLMIGDTVVDIRCGKSAGAQTVGVLCGFGEKKELERVGADMIIQSTTDVLDVLRID
jgi:phosphoglycolate phosphatase-like HAD superfamily hydrolase